jgi:hypothetical protein
VFDLNLNKNKKIRSGSIVQNLSTGDNQFLNQRFKNESFEDRHIIAKHNTIYPTNEEVVFCFLFEISEFF